MIVASCCMCIQRTSSGLLGHEDETSFRLIVRVSGGTFRHRRPERHAALTASTDVHLPQPGAKSTRRVVGKRRVILLHIICTRGLSEVSVL